MKVSEEDRVRPAFEERFGLLQKDGPRPVRTDGTYGASGRPSGPMAPRTSALSPVPATARAALRAEVGALGVYFTHPSSRSWAPA